MNKEYQIKDRDYHPLIDYYNASRLYYFDEEEDCRNIIIGKAANRYINSLFANERNNINIRRCLDKITDYRAKHTVSAFYLGLTVKKMLQLDTRDWRRLPQEKKTDRGSFKLFWSWICMFHDIGYSYEEPNTEGKRIEYLKLKTINEFIEYEKLQYNLLESSKYKSLIENYYKYRISQGKLDHGIVGALLLFDALMKLANDDNNKLYSRIRDFTDFYTRICDAIAKHNMWRANSSNIKIYKEFSLLELIPSEDMSHKIFYSDNTLEFLLALVDTIDPLKAFYKNKRYKDSIEISEILDRVQFRFFIRQKTFIEKFDHQVFREKIKEYVNPEDSLDSWLGVRITVPKDLEYLKIAIDTESSVKKKVAGDFKVN